MRIENTDITQRLISRSDIRQRIGSIFPDSIILDNQFNFVSISQNILEATGYCREELHGKSVAAFSRKNDLKKLLQEKLLHGFFEEEQFEICKKNEGSIIYGISGFYMGLIAEINGIIVLKFKNLDEINLMYDRLEAKTTELDRFVYLSAHALRGPLATMKGLINLSKTTTSPAEQNFIMSQLDIFADKLDDKLHKLIHFAESDKGYESSVHELSIEAVCEALKKSISESSVDHPVQFQHEEIDQTLILENGEVVLSLLRNLVLFFCNQSKVKDNQLLMDIHSSASATEFFLSARGFTLEDSVKEKLITSNFGYSEILNYPELINFYSAKKIVFKLRGDIQFIISSSGMFVLITVPRGTKLSH
jgi:hypothetical protein